MDNGLRAHSTFSKNYEGKIVEWEGYKESDEQLILIFLVTLFNSE